MIEMDYEEKDYSVDIHINEGEYVDDLYNQLQKEWASSGSNGSKSNLRSMKISNASTLIAFFSKNPKVNNGTTRYN